MKSRTVIKVVGVVLVVMAVGYSVLGGMHKHPKERTFGVDVEGEGVQGTVGSSEHEFSKGSEPTAYAMKAVVDASGETESETAVEESSMEYTEEDNGGAGTDFNLPTGSTLTEGNYQYVFSSILVGSPVIYNDFDGLFTDNFLAGVDAFQETNPLYHHMDMNEWVSGDLTTDEFVIRIIDEGEYRYRYTMKGDQIDSIEYLGEE